MRIKQREDYEKQRKGTSELNKVEMTVAGTLSQESCLLIPSLCLPIFVKENARRGDRSYMKNIVWTKIYCLVAGKHLNERKYITSKLKET